MKGRYILVYFMIIFFPSISLAAFSIYLKNGSVISGVSFYESRDSNVILYIGGGSIEIKKEDILKIKETEGPEMDIRVKEEEKKEEVVSPEPSTSTSEEDKDLRIKMLQNELDSVTAEIRKLEAEEGRLVSDINEKRGRRFKYNIYQLRQLEKETEPLLQELHNVQQRKNELLERRAAIEGELRALMR